jgi:hypothetical protein
MSNNRTTKSRLSLFAIMAIGLGLGACGVGLGACGGSHVKTTFGGYPVVTDHTSKVVTPNFSTHNNDRDNDGDHNDDDEKVLDYGHAADVADQRSSTTLMTRYFAAAAAEDGAGVCPLLVPIVAESVVEEEGRSPGSKGSTCAAVMSKLFKLHHQLLAQKQATLRVIKVRVEGNRALAVLEFPTIPEVRQMTERRVAGAWKLVNLFDGILE